ncbi:unnamed protein product [Parnassius apollo]|uniref:(apollo) hypothetical protein n=1 Tax=Parnassius apollo TaxID=110799 RepID=A0A8S3W096_PARAO|nr:unnamed protein product [Parnassius apollo]
MQRTPPQKIKCMSSPDLHREIDSTNNFVTCRKRKEMDDISERSTIFSNIILYEKYIEKLVTNSVRSVLSAELTKITDALTNIQLAVAGIISDMTALKIRYWKLTISLWISITHYVPLSYVKIHLTLVFLGFDFLIESGFGAECWSGK